MAATYPLTQGRGFDSKGVFDFGGGHHVMTLRRRVGDVNSNIVVKQSVAADI